MPHPIHWIGWGRSLNIAWIKTWGGSSTDKAIEIFKTMDDNIVITGYGDSTEAGFDNEANKRYCFLIKFDVDGNILWKRAIRSTVNSNNYYATSLLELNGDLYIVGDYTCDNGTTSDIFLVKMKVEYTMIPESISKESSVFFSPDNTLELSLSTSTVIFENFSYTESVEKKSALDLIVSSTLQYGIKVSIVSDIIGATYGEIVDNSILNIKPSSESSYKQFSSSVKTLQLYENQPIGNSVVHSVDMKLAGKKMNRTDVYKAVLKFEVEQI
jgi:hypothetical protein